PPPGRRRGEELALPFWRARGAPPSLIVMIIDAQRIAMHEQRTVDHRWIREERRAARLAESLAQQEVAVAVHQTDARAARGEAPQKARDHGVERCLEVLVADPI